MEKNKTIENFIISFEMQTHREKGIFMCMGQELIKDVF